MKPGETVLDPSILTTLCSALVRGLGRPPRILLFRSSRWCFFDEVLEFFTSRFGADQITIFVHEDDDRDIAPNLARIHYFARYLGSKDFDPDRPEFRRHDLVVVPYTEAFPNSFFNMPGVTYDQINDRLRRSALPNVWGVGRYGSVFLLRNRDAQVSAGDQLRWFSLRLQYLAASVYPCKIAQYIRSIAKVRTALAGIERELELSEELAANDRPRSHEVGPTKRASGL